MRNPAPLLLALLLPAAAPVLPPPAAAEEAPPRVDLSVRAKPGEAVWFRATSSSRTQHRESRTSEEVVREFSLTAGPRGEDGRTEFALAFVRVHGRVVLPGGDAMEYDSDRPGTLEAFRELLRKAADVEVAIAGKTFPVGIDGTGEVRDVRGWADAARKAFGGEGSIAALNAWHRVADEHYVSVVQAWRPPGPAEPVATGENWTREQVLWAGPWCFLLGLEHELKAADAKEATVASRGKGGLPEAIRAFARKRAAREGAAASADVRPEALEGFAKEAEELKAVVAWEATARLSREDGLPLASEGVLRMRTAVGMEVDLGFRLERLPGPPPGPEKGKGKGGVEKKPSDPPAKGE